MARLLAFLLLVAATAAFAQKPDDAGAEAALKRAIESAAKSYWPTHPETLKATSRLGDFYMDRGRFAEAERAYRQVLAAEEKAGPATSGTAIALSRLGLLEMARQRAAEATLLFERAYAILDKTVDRDSADMAAVARHLGLRYFADGRYSDADRMFTRALGIAERIYARQPVLAMFLKSSAECLLALRRLDGASAAIDRAIRTVETASGTSSPDLVLLLPLQARILSFQRDERGAEAAQRRAVAIVQGGKVPAPVAINAIDDLVTTLRARGRLAEAEALLQAAIEQVERERGQDSVLLVRPLTRLATLRRDQHHHREAEQLLARTLTILEANFGREHGLYGDGLMQLANVYRLQGRWSDAEVLARRALAIDEKGQGAESLAAAVPLEILGLILLEQERNAEAATAFERALRIKEKSRVRPEALLTTIANLAEAKRRQGKGPEAENLMRKSLAQVEALFPANPYKASILNNLALVLQDQGKDAAALESLRESATLLKASFGDTHPDVARAYSNMGTIHLKRRENAEALEYSRLAVEIVDRRVPSARASDDAALAAQARRTAPVHHSRIEVLLLTSSGHTRESHADQAFQTAQRAQASETAGQIANMAARFSTGSDRLASLVRERQSLSAQVRAVEAELVSAMATPSGTPPAELRARIAAGSARVREIDLAIAAEFPAFGELASLRPVSIAEARALLRPREAMVGFLHMQEGSLAWVVRPDASELLLLPVARPDVDRRVAALRKQLDPELAGAMGARRPFDTALAHSLYRDLFGRLEAHLSNVEHLIVVPDAGMQSLPFSLLLTAPVDAAAPFPEMPWLLRRHAISVLPAAGALKAVRTLKRDRRGDEAFRGFGDPVLGGKAVEARNLKPAMFMGRGRVADVSELRKLAPLPETAAELRAIASTLGASPAYVYLGREATESRVKAMDLSRVRNIAFATHGLMAGDFQGLAEPALVLTPPAQGSEADDGLLTASEIARLDLAADWVILSACNTAAGDGTPGAPGLSGLAKAFFFAGARSLLVSHWAVDSDATVALTTQMYAEHAKGAGKAQALRTSMLKLMQRRDRPHYAHPMFWAPFDVVGEGE